jgi:hypothetical protein
MNVDLGRSISFASILWLNSLAELFPSLDGKPLGISTLLDISPKHCNNDIFLKNMEWITP